MVLLKHTPLEIVEREALTINPAKTCQPIGAMYAALGIHRCLPHSHGSQGCCSYHRSTLTRHYREPVMAATSSFTEGSSVFGGQANLLQAVQNIFEMYDPDIIAVHTTCLSETIGDDIPQIVQKAREEEKIPAGKTVIHANTPSYVGSHVTGFANMVKGLVDYLAGKTGVASEHVNILPGWVEPADMVEYKRLAGLMGIPVTVMPDTSGVLDGPQTGHLQMYPTGGVTREQMSRAGDAKATIGLGPTASSAAAGVLQKKFDVASNVIEIPLGLRATDVFIQHLSQETGTPVSSAVTYERGQLMDVITDMHQYFYGRTVALFGDPDQLVPLTQFLVDLDMQPLYVITGTPGKQFEERMQVALGDKAKDCVVRQGSCADLFLLHQLIKNRKPELLIGNTYGKYIARDEDIPFVRFGFPTVDRIGHSYFPTIGYRGGIRLLERILNAVLDRVERDAPPEKFELVL